MKHLKRYLASLGLLLFLFPYFSLPVVAAEKGYAYNDPNLAYYFAGEYNGEEFKQSSKKYNADEGVVTLYQPVMIWSDSDFSKAKLLQVDTYDTIASNLPTQEATLTGEKINLNYATDKSTFTSFKRSYLSMLANSSQTSIDHTLTSAEQYMKYKLEENIKKGSDGTDFSAKVITFAGYPAVITREYSERLADDADGSGDYSMSCFGHIYIYITDMEYPPINFRNYRPYNGMNLTTEEFYKEIGKCYASLELKYDYQAAVWGEPEDKAILLENVRRLYAEAEGAFQESFKKYDQSVSIETKKTTDIKVKNFKPSSIGSVDTDADNDPGETGVTIPEAVGIAILGGGAALGAAGGNSGDDDRKKKSRYKMCLRKDFGDTIPVGDRVVLYARIVEITPEGEERSRDDLSAMIDIVSPDYLLISGKTMTGGYKAAYVEAPASNAVPQTAVVSLRFAGNEGSFTNNVTFKIAERKIIFAQDNLTLPAGYDETERLPFAVMGISADAAVTASVIREDGYSVEIEPGEEMGIYYALITEKLKTKGEAGNYESYTLMIKAECGEQTVTGELPIYRFHMGLRLDISSIGCYAEEYDPARHQSNKFLFAAGDKRYVPAEVKGAVTLYSWDAESHKIQQIAPAALDYKIQAVQETDQTMLDKLAIQCQMTDEVNGGSSLIFRCCKGSLDAPTRFAAKISMTYKRSEEEVYTVEKEVLLRSQPQRRFDSVDGSMAALKSDEKIREWLMSVKTNIWNMNFLNNLFPLVKFIDVMLDGYHEAYGFDAGQVETVKQIWSGFLDGSIKGANAETAKVTLGDEIRLFTDSIMQTEKSLEQSLGFFSRLAVGVATLGCSEVVFTAFETVREMKEYVDKGGDSAFEGFVVGVKVVAKEYLWDLGMGKAIGGLKKVIPPDQAKQAMREMKDNMKESAQRFLTAVTGKQTKAAAADSIKATNQAAGRAVQILEASKSRVGNNLDKAFEVGKTVAREQVDNLRAAAWQFETNPTAANRKLMNEMTLAVQQNKLAMNILQDSTKSELDSVRKSFNETLDVFNVKGDRIAKDKLASITGIPADKIRIMNASSSSRELMRRGKKITYDRDWTAYYTNSKGETVYFDQSLTEQIYADSFYESAKGYKNASAEVSRSFTQSADHTVIENVIGHSESYGSKTNLERMIDKAQHHLELDDPIKAKNAVSHKIIDRINRSRELIAQANTITDSAKQQLVLAEAVGEIIEGGRMASKQFDNIINLRDVARSTGDGVSKIRGELRTAVEICKRHFEAQDQYSLSDLTNGLEAVGFTMESLADELGETLLRIG